LPQITFLGVGDATQPDGANTATLYAGKLKILIDCGPTVPRQLLRVLANPESLDAIWITHQHADHCFGLPSLLLTLRLAGRTKPLELMGGPGSSKLLRELLELGYPGSFRPQKCYALVFTEVEPGKPTLRHDLRLSTARTGHQVCCHALRINDEQTSVCVSGDGKFTAETLQLYRQADLVIHECQWATRLSDDHTSVDELGQLFETANVSRLAVVHCSSHERGKIADRVAKDWSDRAWLPIEGEVREV
jgi:ribonuclease BN (tRNA processing enzyme)